MSIKSEIERLRSELPEGVKLLAVSKFHPVEALQEAYDAGQRAFGESRPQELKAKQAVLPDDIEWHMIGHLQTNKVKYIAPYVHLIESLDSERLAEAIEKEAAKCGRTIDCLLEIHVTK
ncbi:MAG: alanine racemase, partial [Alistipes sp.]|nr:alanine racemase [Alistipes sp.]